MSALCLNYILSVSKVSWKSSSLLETWVTILRFIRPHMIKKPSVSKYGQSRQYPPLTSPKLCFLFWSDIKTDKHQWYKSDIRFYLMESRFGNRDLYTIERSFGKWWGTCFDLRFLYSGIEVCCLLMFVALLAVLQLSVALVAVLSVCLSVCLRKVFTI